MKIVKIGLILFFIIISMNALADAKVQFGENIPIANTTDDTIIPKMCSVSSNKIFIAWADGERLFFTRSLDGGKTFEDKRQLCEQGEINAHPEIGVDSNGRIYILYQDLHDTLDMTLKMGISDDDGETFETRTIDSGRFLNYCLYPDMKIVDDTIYYSSNNYFVRITDGGDSVELFDNFNNSQNYEEGVFSSSIGIDANQNIYIIYFKTKYNSEDNIVLADLYFTRMEAGSDHFSESTLVEATNSFAGFISKPSLVVTSVGNLYLFWNKGPSDLSEVSTCEDCLPMHFAYSNDMGETFSEISEITFGRQTDALEATIATFDVVVDQNNAMHFLYHYFDGLFYSKSSDLCTTFDESVEFSTDGFLSDMQLNDNGEVYMAWLESNDSESGQLFFAKAVEESGSDNNNSDDTTGGGDDGGGGGCFISVMGD